MVTEQYFVKESHAIVSSVFNKIIEDKKTEIVIIPGDLVKNGEKESHKSFIKELYRLKENGKNVYDYNASAYILKGDGRVPVAGTDFDSLCDMYRDFGYADSIAFDEATHSYVAEIVSGIRMLAICCDSKGQPKGAMDERLMAWAKEQLDKAKEDGCSVFAICHYPIIPSVPVFDLVGDAKIKEWRKVASFLADNGVELVLTGHMHIQSINEFYSEKGNRLIDICTACLVGSPAKYRKITIDENSILKVRAQDIPDFGWNLNGLTPQEYFDNHFSTAIVARVCGALNGGNGVVKHLKSFVRKRFDKITVGTIKNLEEFYMFDSEQVNYGTLNEKPCPGYYNDGQFDALVETGDVLAMFTGHDHTNAFGVRNQNIDIYTSPMTRYKGLAYTTQYGYRVVEIDEKDTSTYETRVERLYDVFDFNYIKTAKDNGDKYSTRLAFELAVKGTVQEGFMKLYQSVIELITGRQVTYPD